MPSLLQSAGDHTDHPWNHGRDPAPGLQTKDRRLLQRLAADVQSTFKEFSVDRQKLKGTSCDFLAVISQSHLYAVCSLDYNENI